MAKVASVSRSEMRAVASKGMTLARLLVPLDFSAGSLAGLDYAVDLGKQFGAELVLLFVVEPLYYAGDLGLLLEEQQRFGREEMARLEARLKKQGVAFRTLVQTGTPYQVIVDVARRLRVDLVVMASHGRTGLSHMLLGSVAEKVVRTAACPVLTIRPRARTARR